MRAAATGEREQAARMISARAAPGVTIAALALPEFTSAYGFSMPERTKSLPIGVERWLEAARRSES